MVVKTKPTKTRYLTIVSCAFMLAAAAAAVNPRPNAGTAIGQGKMTADHAVSTFEEQATIVAREFNIASFGRHIRDGSVALFYATGDGYAWLQDTLPRAAKPFDRMGIVLRDGLYYVISLDWLMLPDPILPQWQASNGEATAPVSRPSEATAIQ